MPSAASPRHTSSGSRSAWPWGAGLVGACAVVLGAAALPPLVPEAWRPSLMQAFAPACHQLPARSPHIGGVALAVCDRCAGLYLGVVLGSALALRGRGPLPRWMLVVAAGPLVLDWGAPLLHVWTNTPWSRALTGGLFGIAAGALTLAALLRSGQRVTRDACQEDAEGKAL